MKNQNLPPICRTGLQGIAISLNRLYDEVSSIADDYEGSAEASQKTQGCINHGGGSPRHSAYPQSKGISRVEGDVGIDEAELTMRCAYLRCNPGKKGRSGDNPLLPILYDLTILKDKIERMCGTDTPQTMQGLQSLRASSRQSDDVSIHAQIDTSIGTNNYPLS